jgi:hypothetical protein
MIPWLNLRWTSIGKDVENCCHDLNWSDMWTGKDVTGSFHEQFEEIWLSTDDKEWCHDLIWCALWIGTDGI